MMRLMLAAAVTLLLILVLVPLAGLVGAFLGFIVAARLT